MLYTNPEDFIIELQDRIIKELAAKEDKQLKEILKMADTVELNDYAMEDDHLTGSASHDTPSLDELQNVTIDREAVQQDKAAMFLPTGDYMWRDRKFSTSKSGDGRLFLRWYGKVESKTGDAEGQFQLSLSPEKRFRKDSNGNPTKELDNFYKAWLSADDLYFKLHESNAERITQVIEMLNTETFWMNITRGKNGGNFFQGFKKI